MTSTTDNLIRPAINEAIAAMDELRAEQESDPEQMYHTQMHGWRRLWVARDRLAAVRDWVSKRGGGVPTPETFRALAEWVEVNPSIENSAANGRDHEFVSAGYILRRIADALEAQS